MVLDFSAAVTEAASWYVENGSKVSIIHTQIVIQFDTVFEGDFSASGGALKLQRGNSRKSLN